MERARPAAIRPAGRLLPGSLLCLAITATALVVEALEKRGFGRAWLEALILAILFGAALRSVWQPPVAAEPGIRFCSKSVLEVGIALLGLTVSPEALKVTGPSLLLGIAAIVALSVCASYAIGRALKLPRTLAMLIACGNSICGNTAIVAVAPVLEADMEEVGAAIAFTAVLGILVVLVLPPLCLWLRLTQVQSGVLAGLTIYSVSQVVAATAPMGALSVQIGTLVKLARILLLGPVMFALSFSAGRRSEGRPLPPALGMIAPRFILAFVAMVGLRTTGHVPAPVIAAAGAVANVMIVVAMAALGLCVDIAAMKRAGARVMTAVCLSLIVLGVISLGLIRLLGV